MPTPLHPRERPVVVLTRLAARLALFTLSLAVAQGCASRHAGVGQRGDAAVDQGGEVQVDVQIDTRFEAGPEGAPGSDGGSTVGGQDARADTQAAADAPVGPDAPAGADAATGDGGFGAGCNALTLGAPVTFACVTGDAGAPAGPTGGTIVPGLYNLTAATLYGSCIDGISAAQTLAITATTVQAVADDPIIGLQRLDATYTLAGTDMVQTNTCPNTETRTVGYSATPTTLTVFSVSPGLTTVGVLTRQ